MRTWFTKNLINFSVTVITTLLITNIFLTVRNGRIIEDTQHRKHESTLIKNTLSQFAIVIIHNLDLGLRGYALFGDEKYLYPMRFALNDKDSLMNNMESLLVKHQYPLAEFDILRDSIDSYANFCVNLLALFRAKEMEEFYTLADQDRGYHVWLQYEKFRDKVNLFEDAINQHAEVRYRNALRNNSLIEIILFAICLPTLLFSAINVTRKFSIEKKLKVIEAEKASILESQNKVLARAVEERTREIDLKNRQLQIQNDEINVQNEEIKAQNEELTLQREVLAAQNEALAASKKEQLELFKRNLMEKSSLITEITEELEMLRRRFSPEQEHVQKLKTILNLSILTDEDWERFKKAFQEVYPDFFVGLRYKFPGITASELRLAALVKMNLTLKEAANMLGISSDSVKKSRYRLKKRLGISDEKSLTEFVGGF